MVSDQNARDDFLIEYQELDEERKVKFEKQIAYKFGKALSSLNRDWKAQDYVPQNHYLATRYAELNGDMSVLRDEISSRLENNIMLGDRIDDSINLLARITPGRAIGLLVEQHLDEVTTQAVINTLASQHPQELYRAFIDGVLAEETIMQSLDTIIESDPKHTPFWLSNLPLDFEQQTMALRKYVESSNLSDLALNITRTPALVEILKEIDSIDVIESKMETEFGRLITDAEKLAYLTQFIGHPIFGEKAEELRAKTYQSIGKKVQNLIEQNPNLTPNMSINSPKLNYDFLMHELSDRSVEGPLMGLSYEQASYALALGYLPTIIHDRDALENFELDYSDVMLLPLAGTLTGLEKKILFDNFIIGAEQYPEFVSLLLEFKPEEFSQEQEEKIKQMATDAWRNYKEGNNVYLYDTETHYLSLFTTLVMNLEDDEFVDNWIGLIAQDPEIMWDITNLSGEMIDKLKKRLTKKQKEQFMYFDNPQTVYEILEWLHYENVEEEVTLFETAKAIHPELTVFKSIDEFKKFNELFTVFDILKQNGLKEFLQLLEEYPQEIKTITKFIHNPRSSMHNFTGLCRLAVFAKEHGISDDEISGFVHACDSIMGGDPFKSLPSERKEELQRVNNVLLQNKEKTQSFIVRHSEISWSDVNPKLFDNLVNPENGSYMEFPLLIAQEGLDFDEENQKKLVQLLQTKYLENGQAARVQLASDLLFLSSTETGKKLASDLINKTNASKKDPSRLRQAVRYARIQHQINGNIQYEEKDDLNETIQDLRKRAAIAVSQKLDIPEDMIERFESGFDNTMRKGLIDILSALLYKYEAGNYETASQLTRDAIRAEILGEFKEWRESLPNSQVQLELLETEERISSWLESIDPVSLQVGESSEQDKWTNAISSIKNITKTAVFHIREEVPNLEISEQKASELKQNRDTLTRKLKKENLSDKEVKKLGIQRTKIEAELAVVEGIIRLEQVGISDNYDEILTIVAKTRSSLLQFGANQAHIDLGQIFKVLQELDVQREQLELTAVDTDDAVSLFNTGVIPIETCQSWKEGSHNHCLPSYIADVNKRIIIVRNGEQVIGRAIIKATKIRTPVNQENEQALLMEPIHTLVSSKATQKAVVRAALTKAVRSDMILVSARDYQGSYSGESEETNSILLREASALGFQVTEEEVEVYIPESNNSHEYSDSIDGAISYFDRWGKIRAYVARRPENQ